MQKAERQVSSVVWRHAGSLPALRTGAPHPGLAGAAAGIHNNVVIIGGGANFLDAVPWRGGKKQYHDALYVFKKNDRDYRPLNGQRFALPFPVAYGASCSTPEGIIYAGGENGDGPLNTILLIRHDGGSGEVMIDRLPDLPFAVTNASITEDSGKIYLAGGETTNGVSDKLLCLDLHRSGGGWTYLTDLPQAMSHAVLVVAGDERRKHLYLIGGRRKGASGISDFFASNFLFDLQTKQWHERASLPYGISAGTGCSTGSEVVLFGGDRGETFQATEELLVRISNEENASGKDSLTRRKDQIQEGHPGFAKEILKYSVDQDKWSGIGQIPFDAPVTTTAFQSGEFDILIPSGEIRAGVRTPVLLEATFVFD